jgi:isocitrate/isopropylmalate dehydrogenase
MFEPVCGSAPDIAGKNLANPMAAILAAGMMLDELGLTDILSHIVEVLAKAIHRGITTPDLGGKVTTCQVAEWVRTHL